VSSSSRQLLLLPGCFLAPVREQFIDEADCPRHRSAEGCAKSVEYRFPTLQHQPITIHMRHQDFTGSQVERVAETGRDDHAALRTYPDVSVLCHDGPDYGTVRQQWHAWSYVPPLATGPVQMNGRNGEAND